MRNLIIVCLCLLAGQALGQSTIRRGGDVQLQLNGAELPHGFVGGLNNPLFANIDLNGDAYPDLHIFDHGDNSQYLFEHSGNAGSGEFIHRPDLEHLLPDTLNGNWMRLADFDRDGDQDIFSGYAGGVYVHVNQRIPTGQLGFETRTTPLRSDYFAFESNLYVAPVDVPAFTDIDGDGDIDVLTYDVTGGQVEWHRNMQVDSGWAADSMKFILTSQCWGHFLEVYDIQTMTYDVNINQTPCDQPAGKTMHAGGTLLPINLNADSLMDLVVSDVDVEYTIGLRNGGATNYASMDSVINPWPPSYPVSLSVFPSLSYADVTGDGTPDLLAAPYQLDNFNDYAAVWRYTNTGQVDLPTFDFQEENFLQSGMLDGGTHAVPLVHDFNGDSLPDLLLAIGERFIAPWQEKPGVFYFYANIGDSSQAVFDAPVQVLENATVLMGNLPQQQHTVGDLDADGRLDMLVGYGNEKMLRLEANGNFTNGFPDMDTVPFSLPELGFNGLLNPMPELYDLDADGDLDLFVGQRNGRLAYFENQGDSSSPDFVLITQNFGKFDASNANGQLHVRVRTLGADTLPSLVLGTASGQFLRLDSLSADTSQTQTLLPFLEDFALTRSPALEVLTTRASDDSLRVNYLVGRWLGGLQLYSEQIFAPDTSVSDSDTTISRSELLSDGLRAYPNPVKAQLVVETPAPGQLSLYDAAGRLCLRRSVARGNQTLELQELPQGVYLLELRTPQKHYTGQIVKQ